MEEIIRKHFGLVIICLYIVGVFAFFGVFAFIKIAEIGSYNADNLTHDIYKSLICGIFPLIYPIVRYIKYKKSA